MNVSAVLVVRNEQHRLEACLRALRPHVAEVVVYDQASDDGTFEDAIGYKHDGLIDVLVGHPNHGTPEVSRPEAIDRAKGPWILLMDADETLNPTFAQTLAALTDGPYDFIHLRRVTTIDGAQIEDCPHRRLFRKGFGVAPVYANLGGYAHSSVGVVKDAREFTPPEVAIIHAKTDAEQQIDNVRSDRLLEMRDKGDAGRKYIGGYPWMTSGA